MKLIRRTFYLIGVIILIYIVFNYVMFVRDIQPNTMPVFMYIAQALGLGIAIMIFIPFVNTSSLDKDNKSFKDVIQTVKDNDFLNNNISITAEQNSHSGDIEQISNENTASSKNKKNKKVLLEKTKKRKSNKTKNIKGSRLKLSRKKRQIAASYDNKKEYQNNLLSIDRIPMHQLTGKETTLDKIRHEFLRSEAGAFIILSGIPGVGKTAIASEYIRRYADKYDNWGYFPFRFTLEQTFTDGVNRNIVEIEKGVRTIEEQYKSIMHWVLLQSRQRKKMLIVIDGYEDNYDKIAKIVNDYNGAADFIITTRMEKVSAVGRYWMDILPITDLDEQRALFEYYYNNDKSNQSHKLKNDHELVQIDNLLDMAQGLPGAIEIIAKNCKYFRIPFNKMFTELNKINFFMPSYSEGREVSVDLMMDQLTKLLPISYLNPFEEHIIGCMGMFPQTTISHEDFIKLMDINKDTTIEKLTAMGFINNFNGEYIMMPYVQDIVFSIGLCDNVDLEPLFKRLSDYIDNTKEVDKRGKWFMFADELNEFITEDSSECVNLFRAMSQYCHNNSQSFRAIDFLMDAIDHKQQLGITDDDECLRLSEAVAALWNEAGNIDNTIEWKQILAEKYYKRKMWDKLIDSCNNLAWLLRGENKHIEAIKWKKLGIGYIEKTMGINHQSLTTEYNILAQMCYAINDYQNGREYMRQAMELGNSQMINAEDVDTAPKY